MRASTADVHVMTMFDTTGRTAKLIRTHVTPANVAPDSVVIDVITCGGFVVPSSTGPEGPTSLPVGAVVFGRIVGAGSNVLLEPGTNGPALHIGDTVFAFTGVPEATESTALATVATCHATMCFPVVLVTEGAPAATVVREGPPLPQVTRADIGCVCAGLLQAVSAMHLLQSQMLLEFGDRVLLVAAGTTSKETLALNCGAAAGSLPIVWQILRRVFKCHVTAVVRTAAVAQSLRSAGESGALPNDVVVLEEEAKLTDVCAAILRRGSGGVGFDAAVVVQCAPGQSETSILHSDLVNRVLRVGGKIGFITPTALDEAQQLETTERAAEMAATGLRRSAQISFCDASVAFASVGGAYVRKRATFMALIGATLRLLLPARCFATIATDGVNSSASSDAEDGEDALDPVVRVALGYNGRVLKSAGLFSAFTEVLLLPESAVIAGGLPIVTVDP